MEMKSTKINRNSKVLFFWMSNIPLILPFCPGDGDLSAITTLPGVRGWHLLPTAASVILNTV